MSTFDKPLPTHAGCLIAIVGFVVVATVIVVSLFSSKTKLVMNIGLTS